MAWVAGRMTDEIAKMVMVVYTQMYESGKKKESYEDWLSWHDIRPQNRWTIVERRSLKIGRLVTVHGVEEQTSFLFVYDPSGKLVGSFPEHHGQDRGPNRRERVTKLLGAQGARLL